MNDDRILNDVFSFSDIPFECYNCKSPERFRNRFRVCWHCRERLLIAKAKEEVLNELCNVINDIEIKRIPTDESYCKLRNKIKSLSIQENPK